MACSRNSEGFIIEHVGQGFFINEVETEDGQIEPYLCRFQSKRDAKEFVKLVCEKHGLRRDEVEIRPYDVIVDVLLTVEPLQA